MTIPANQKNYSRVVIFLPDKSYTGGERYLVEVCNYLKLKNVTIEPIYIEHSNKSRDGLGLVINCLLSNLRFFNKIRHLGKLSNVVFFEDFYLHPRLWLFNILVRLTIGELKMVVLVQSALFYHSILKKWWAKWIDQKIVRFFLRQASLILTNSNFIKQQVLSLGIDLNQIKVVYCGYEKLLPNHSTKSRLNKDKKVHKRILFVGQCVEIKGIEFLLKAIPMISDKKVKIDIVGNMEGDPKYFTRLTHIVKELSLKDRVIFHSHIRDKNLLVKFYQHANIFVLPSLVESFGIVILEAMSFGLPIVATNVGAIPELIQNEVHGLLVSPANPKELAKAINKLLNSPNLRENYGRNGYIFAQEKKKFYSWEAVGKRVFQAMRQLLETEPT